MCLTTPARFSELQLQKYGDRIIMLRLYSHLAASVGCMVHANYMRALIIITTCQCFFLSVGVGQVLRVVCELAIASSMAALSSVQ